MLPEVPPLEELLRILNSSEGILSCPHILWERIHVLRGRFTEAEPNDVVLAGSGQTSSELLW